MTAALTAAIVALLTVWVTPAGERVLVAHARKAGGQAYVAELAQGALAVAAAHRIDAYLLVALAHEESGLSRYAVQPETKSWGLLQLHPRSRWHRKARAACDKRPSHCVRAQLEQGAVAFRYALDACTSPIGGVFFHRSGRCAGARARDKRVLVLAEQLKQQGQS